MRFFARNALLLLVVLVAAGVAAQSSEDDVTFQNPIINTNFPDPFILLVDGVYYGYSTNSNSRNLPVARSTDLVTWELLRRDAMPALARWVNLSGPDVWAPEVIQIDDQFLLYYTARNKETGRQCVGVAIADSPEGPFRDPNDAPFVCQTQEGGSIDASPFRDEDGTLYLLWKNDGNCCGRATWLYSQQMTPDGLSLVGEPVQLIRNDRAWKGPVVEAPTLWKNEHGYFLFYSGNVYSGDAYAVGYATCETPLGPCTDAEENPILASDLTAQPLVVGPGHQTVIADAEGQTWLVYHAWQTTRGGRLTTTRQVWIDRLDWVDGRPVVQGPTRDPQPAPATAASGEA